MPFPSQHKNLNIVGRGGQKHTALPMVVRFMMRMRIMMVMVMVMVMMMVMVMLLRWMFRTRRKMMMLRRKTDPKTGKHTLSKLAQSKCTWSFHKGKMHISQVFTRATLYGNLRKNAGPQSRARHFAQACVVECTWTFHKSHFVWTLKEKMPDPHPRHGIL